MYIYICIYIYWLYIIYVILYIIYFLYTYYIYIYIYNRLFVSFNVTSVRKRLC